MAFRTYSFLAHGIPTTDKDFNDVDTYITVVSSYPGAVGGSIQARGLAAIKELFNVIYEGPVAFNHFHHERAYPSQKIIIFEKKEPPSVDKIPLV